MYIYFYTDCNRIEEENKVFIRMEEPLMIRIRDINPHIVCSLCAGYFIDATTIAECLHTFCKSCIVKYLQSSVHCPQCSIKIHETMPLMNLKPDRVMQDIVYKLVPHLYDSEENRKQEFYKSRGLVKEKKQEDENTPPSLSSVYDNPKGHYYRNDELVSFCLERFNPDPICPGGFRLGTLPKKFVRCSARTAVFHVKHLLRKKLMIPGRYRLEVLCNDQAVDKDMTLKHVWLAHWYGKPSPLMLYYRVSLANERISFHWP